MSSFELRRLAGLVPKSRTRVIAVVSAFIVLAVVSGTALAILPGSPSSFESNDGNMIVNTTGNHDWANVAFTRVQDTFNSNSDNSFTPGQKQDTTCPTTTGHKNPGKDDFTDVASYSETASGGAHDGETYLYGATIRFTANGNAAENVELKQSDELCPGQPAGGLTVRSAGDKLIAIDYLQGGTNVQFHVLTWITTNTAEACFVGNDVAPCWGSTVLELSAAGAEGLASQAAITAANNPINHQALVAGQFAEFGVNLAVAEIIPKGTCKAFPQTVWESRSSGSSFVSSVKDISIENQTISNCGQIIIRKVTDPTPDPTDTTFSYTTTGGLDPSTFDLKDQESQDYGEEVAAGSYSVTESDPSADNFELTDIDCSASDLTHGSTATPTLGTGTVDIELEPGDVVDCTYTNTLQTGALQIAKNSTKGGAVTNAGAVFSYDSSSVTDTDDGTLGDEDTAVGSVCVSGLSPGTYTVNETSPPPGYGDAADSEADQVVTVVAGTDCTDNLPGVGATATFTNPPLSDIQVRFRDGGSNETSATISCDNTTGTGDDNNTTGWDTTHTVTGVEAPTTVECTIVIDP